MGVSEKVDSKNLWQSTHLREGGEGRDRDAIATPTKFDSFDTLSFQTKESGYLLFLFFSFTYSREHKSSDSFFSKILEKPSIVQKKMMPYINGLLFFSEMKQKRKKIKMTASISSSANFQYFSWNFYELVLGLVDLIDAKGIGVD